MVGCLAQAEDYPLVLAIGDEGVRALYKSL